MTRLKKILLFFLFIIGTVALCSIVISTVSTETLNNLKRSLDAGWWFVSFMRWGLLAFLIIWFIPKMVQRKITREEQAIESLSEEIESARTQGATYETLASLESEYQDSLSMYSVFQKMKDNHKIVALSLVTIELFVVQLPHFI